MILNTIVAVCVGAGLATASAQDAERATHGNAAATPQVAYERTAGNVTVRQYQLGCLSQLTYLVVSRGHALVVDPQRDVDHYVRDARAMGARIEYVALTHTNADFVAGHTELAQREGARILIAAESGSQFEHQGMRDGDSVDLGAARIEFIATPGHTLDSMTVLVHAPKGPDVEADPLWIMTGDALFIGSIGRPDLAQGSISPMALANHAYDSIQRLRALPEATIVLPAHGAGSLCGAHLSPDTTSTIGREKAQNAYFQIASRAAFVARDVSGLPPAPQYFAYNVAINRKGPPVVDWTEELPLALEPAAVRDLVKSGAWVVDLRDGPAYAAEHIQGSINVSVRGRLDTWTGSVIPFDAPLVLVGSSDEAREAAFRFKRIGIDHVVGRLAPDFEKARRAGLAVRATELVAPKQLADRIARHVEPIVVDVRTGEERAELSLGDYAHIELTDWKRFGDVLDKQAPVLFVCNSSYRSSMAVGLAERLGFEHVGSLDGGLDAWLEAGLPVQGTASVCADVPKTTTATRPVAEPGAASTLDLPEALEPAQLAAFLIDQPRSYTVIDVRPAWQFGEYHIPSAVNVEPDQVRARLATLPRNMRVVLVDRDGTTAFAVAGAVASASDQVARPLRVLSGGTARFWREIGVRGGVSAPSSQDPAPAAAPAATPAAAPTPGAPKPETKKRSAGC